MSSAAAASSSASAYSSRRCPPDDPTWPSTSSWIADSAANRPVPSANTRGHAFAFRWSVISLAHLRQAGSENESDGARRWSTWSSRPARVAARIRSAGIGPGAIAQRNDPVPVRADPSSRGGHHGRGDAERGQPAIVDQVRAVVVASEHDDGQAAVAGHRVGQPPGPDPLRVHPGDDRHAGVEAFVERRPGALGAPGLVDVGLDAEPVERLAGPAGDPRVLPLVAEPEREHRRAVALELPQDVAGAQAAADAEDRGLGQRLARQARDDALVRQDVGQRGRLRVQATAHPVAVRGHGVRRRVRGMSVARAVDQGPPGRGVPLAGLRHARAHDPLEGLVGGHRSGLRHGRRRPRPHRHVAGRSDGRPVRPEDPDPLYRRIAAPRGGSVWQSGAGARRRQCTTPGIACQRRARACRGRRVLGGIGSGGRTRTYDQVINSHPLYQLSYAGAKRPAAAGLGAPSRRRADRSRTRPGRAAGHPRLGAMSLISPEELLARLDDPSLRICDVRW